ncbi:MAG: hypothetical protein J0I12_05035 [Candidatus Eremiobacteraeota bacterium]|nr:hypothetical protein [Candidatus Eremiobacteraeota bacterium]
MKRIGLDFDNTIACYDQAFHQVAVIQKLLPAEPVLDKRGVKDEVIRLHGESHWTRLQGFMYGSEIGRARPFDGCLPFVRQAVQLGWQVWVVSHKSPTPVLGAPWDLHKAARDWLGHQGFWEAGLDPERVFFEPTREAKLQRITQLHCQVFVDDLAEVFREELFPAAVERWLFHPNPPEGPWRPMRDWQSASAWLQPASGE